MTHYVAFLRAINVGGHTVKMAGLRGLFAELGFANVATYIASGNVIFTSTARGDDLERLIEMHLQRALGYPVATFVRSIAEVAAVARYAAFPAVDVEPQASHHVAFLHASPGVAAQERVLALQTATDEFHFHQRELYWLCRTRQSDSTFSGAVLEKTLGMEATFRNMNTVRKIAALYPEGAQR